MDVPTFKNEKEFQKWLAQHLREKWGITQVDIRPLGADLRVFFDEEKVDVKLQRNFKHIKVSNPFFIETKVSDRGTQNVVKGIRQCFTKYLTKNEETQFLATPNSIFTPMKKFNFRTYVPYYAEPVFFPNKQDDWSKYFNRTCWVFDIGVVGGYEPTGFFLNGGKFYLSKR